MNNKYRVLLPKWVFQSNHTEQIRQDAERYLLRYPDYYLCNIKDGFAICDRK